MPSLPSLPSYGYKTERAWAGLKGKSGPPGNMNAFKHGLAPIQKRREEGVPTEHEENVRQQILGGLIADKGGDESGIDGHEDSSGSFRCRKNFDEWVLNNPECKRETATFSLPLATKKLPPRSLVIFRQKVTVNFPRPQFD